MEKYRQKIKGRRACRHFVDIPWLRAVKSWNKQAKHFVQKHKKGQAYLSSFLSPTFLHLHHFPLHLLSLFSLVLFFVLSSSLISLPTLTIFDVLVLLVCFILSYYFILSYMFFSLLSSSLFSVYCPTILEQHRNNKNNKRPKTSEHWHFGIPLSLPIPFETIIFLVLLHFSSFGFVFLMFVLFASGFTSSCCFQNKVCVLGCCWFLIFLFWGFKGQVRWPEGPPHLALNPLYICCRKRIPSNLSLLEVKIWSPRGDQILLLSASTFVYSGFGAGIPVHK